MPQFRERIAGLFASSSSSAISFRVSGDTQDRILIDAGGRISLGSGTLTPDVIFQRSDIEIARLTGTLIVNANASGDQNSGLRLVSSSATTHTNWRIGSQVLVGGLEFTPSTTVGGSTFSTPAMVILSNSNVGIGTSSPGYKLDVTGRVRLRSDGASSSGLWFTGDTGAANIFFGQTGTTSTSALGVFSNSAWRFYFHHSGGISIGAATDPGAGNLRVNGTITSDTGFTGSLSGNALTATTLLNSRLINEVSFNGSANITIPRTRALDDRIVAPADFTERYVTSIFTSWDNNNASPYADALVFRTYGDATGGSDNMLSLRKNALGLRVWQQTYGSATAFATFKDVAWTDGTNATGTWSIATTGNAGSATQLQNGRTINGTSFDGTANIITANWGTSRTIQIGSSAKSVNGSANVTWTISEIGAASKSELESVLGDLMYVGAYDAQTNAPSTKPVPTWSGGPTVYRHGMYWVVSSSGDLDFLDIDLSQRESQNADGTTQVSRADWIIATNPNYNPSNPNVNLAVGDIVWKWISFSAENYIRQEIANHASDDADPHSAAGYIKESFADTRYAPMIHNHNADILARILEHEGKTDPHPGYMTQVESDVRYYTKTEVDTVISSIEHEVIVTDGAASARVFIGSTEPASGTRLVGDLWVESPNISLQPPSEPSNLTATAVSTSQINLSWAAWPSTTVQSAVQVERRNGSDWTTIAPTQILNDTTSPFALTLNDTGRSANTTYFYRVRAQNVNGGTQNGVWGYVSATTLPIIDTTPPAVPTITYFKPVGGYGQMEVRVTWPADADTNYGEILYYASNGASPVTWNGSITPSQVTTINFSSAPYNITGVAGATGTVSVRARDSNQNWSNSAQATYTLLESPYYIAADSSNSWRNENNGRYNVLGNFRLVQGYYSTPSLNSTGLWYYGTKIADQIWNVSRTFSNVEIYMQRNTGGSGSPQAVSIVLHSQTTNPGTVSNNAPEPATFETPTAVATLAWGGGSAWAVIPSGWWSSLLNGTRKGVAIKDSDGQPYVILDSVAENGYSGMLKITHLG